jgi:hypothetical protein
MQAQQATKGLLTYLSHRARRTATEALKILWEECFFASWQAKGSIDDVLDKRGNHFSNAELGMALKRAKHLTRRGRRGRYEYIQKYPHIVEEIAGTSVEGKGHD